MFRSPPSPPKNTICCTPCLTPPGANCALTNLQGRGRPGNCGGSFLGPAGALYKEGSAWWNREQPLGEILVRASATAGSFVIRPEASPRSAGRLWSPLPESAEARENPEREFTENGIDPEERD